MEGPEQPGQEGCWLCLVTLLADSAFLRNSTSLGRKGSERLALRTFWNLRPRREEWERLNQTCRCARILKRAECGCSLGRKAPRQAAGLPSGISRAPTPLQAAPQLLTPSVFCFPQNCLCSPLLCFSHNLSPFPPGWATPPLSLSCNLSCCWGLEEPGWFERRPRCFSGRN